jgi:hypothetical protein
MSLLWSKNGFRGEYLARFMVSKIAFISESRVGEDFGIDFYCGLVKDSTNIKNVYFDKPFLLQIKTSIKKVDIVYDTKNKIETLYNLNLPFFIGRLDLKEKILTIHSTSMMWHPYLVTGISNISKVTFRFRESDSNTDDISIPEIKHIRSSKKSNKSGNQMNHIVDLGHPIISMDLSKIETDISFVETCRKIMSKCIDKEEANILNKKLMLYYYRWVCTYQTNNSDIKFGYNFLRNEDGVSGIDPQDSIKKLDHYLVSLAIAFSEIGDLVNFENVCKLTRKIPKRQHLDVIKNNYPKIYKE